MSGINLEELGLTKDDLQDRLIDALCERMLQRHDIDDDGCLIDDSRLREELDKAIKARIDEGIQRLARIHLLPKVDDMVENIVIQKTNDWGEPKGEALTFIEYLIARAEAYMTEKVSRDGKSKNEDSYNFRAHTTRITYLIDQHLHYSIQTAMKKAMNDANSAIADGLQGAVKLALKQATENLTVTAKIK